MIIDCGSVSLGVDELGHGPNAVLIHGAWSDRSTWDPVFSQLSEGHRTIRYDRRGYGESTRPGTGPEGHVEDLLALLRVLELERVTLIGNSFGALVALRAAHLAPERVSLVIAHEPPILRLFELESTHDPAVARAYGALVRALDAAREGNSELAAKLYVEGMASYPGAWAYLPEPVQRGFVDNATAFLSDTDDLVELDLELDLLQGLRDRLVITHGARTSPYMKSLMERLFRMQPALPRHVFATGGHVPHQSGPEEFVTKTVELVRAAVG